MHHEQMTITSQATRGLGTTGVVVVKDVKTGFLSQPVIGL